jgi:hypothetical protein
MFSSQCDLCVQPSLHTMFKLTKSPLLSSRMNVTYMYITQWAGGILCSFMIYKLIKLSLVVFSHTLVQRVYLIFHVYSSTDTEETL